VSDFSFGKDKRLLNASDYKPVFDHADIKASHKHLLLLARQNNLPHNRIGLVMAKKNIRLAVQRNRIKRIIRECFRCSSMCSTMSTRLDIVVLARRGLDTLSNSEIHLLIDKQFQQLNKKLNQLGNPKD
jgi:ribonuclease P protein component